MLETIFYCLRIFFSLKLEIKSILPSVFYNMLSFPSSSLLITPSITVNFFALYLILVCFTHLSGGSAVKNPHAMQEKVAEDLGSIPESGRSSGEGSGNPLLTCQAPLSMGILQARILEWVVMTSSRGPSQPRDWTQVSCIVVDSLPSEPPRKPKNAGVSSLSLLQGIFQTQESSQGLLHCRWILYQLSYQGSAEPLGKPLRPLSRSLSCLMYGQHLKYLFSPFCKTSSSLSFQDTIPSWISSYLSVHFIDFLIIFLHLSNLEMLASPRLCPLTYLDF